MLADMADIASVGRGGSTSTLTQDWVLRGLLVALTAETAVGMALSVSGLDSANRPGPQLSSVRGWLGLVWFGLVIAVAVRAAGRIRRLDQLVSVRQDQLAAVAATSRDWLWEATLTGGSSVDLVLSDCSPSITGLLGLSPKDVVGRPLLDLLWPDDVGRARATMEGAVQSRTGWEDVELCWRHAEGHVVRMLGSAVPVFDGSGSVVGFRGARRQAPSDTDARRRLAAIRHRVADVVESSSLSVALQPIVSLQTGGWVGAEALARFSDGRAPDVWFAEAHEAGMGIELELVALRAALALFEELPDEVGLSVNASPELFLDPRMIGALTAPGVPTERVTVELTEHAIVSRYDELHQALAPLRERGLRLAVDDTGAGYASFSHVLRLRPDTIKLDRSLTGGIDADPARRAFVTAIVLLGLELGAEVTAEGVETPAEHLTLANLGVDQAQGYLLARPSVDRARWHSWRDWRWNVPTGAALDRPEPIHL